MAQVDHRVGQGLEGIVGIGDELVANQHATKLTAREVRQDKFISLNTQTRWNPLPVLALRHFVCQSSRILPDAADLTQTQCSRGLADNSNFRKTRNQLKVQVMTTRLVGIPRIYRSALNPKIASHIVLAFLQHSLGVLTF